MTNIVTNPIVGETYQDAIGINLTYVEKSERGFYLFTSDNNGLYLTIELNEPKFKGTFISFIAMPKIFPHPSNN